MQTIFFYGLFMDETLLTDQGLHPEVVGPAVLPDYRIHIGERATLLPVEWGRTYGMVMRLEDVEASALYADPSVSEYVPETVRVELLDDGEPLDAVCYNLPADLVDGTNPAYASRLARLVESLGFDPDYVAEIDAFGA